ncbi:phage minor capsid protein [Dellaglioa sp. L3N]
MAITPRQLSTESGALSDVYLSLEDEIFKMIVKRLKTSNFDDLDKDNVFKWQLKKMNEANMFNGDVIKELTKTTKISKKKLQSLIVDNGYQIADEANAEFSKFKGVEIPPLSNMDQQLKGYLNQSFLDIDNLVNQTLITTNYGKGSAQKIYEDIIKNTTAGVITGLKTPNKAISDTIYKWMDKGIPSSFMDKGGHTWSIESYVRMVVNTTTRNAYHEIRTEGMDRYGIETCLMSSHASARPACAPIQGRVVYMRPSELGDKYPSVYDHGYKEPAGVAGINCHHTFTPWDPDINIIRDVEEVPSPDEAIKNSDIQAKQRQLERQVRQNKRKLNTANELGDEQGIKKYKNLIKKNQSALRQHVDGHGFLHRDYSREKVFGSKVNDVNKSDNLQKIKMTSKSKKVIEKYKPDKNPFGSGISDKLSEKELKPINELLNKAPTDVQRLFAKYKDDLKIAGTKDNNPRYTPKFRTVSMNVAKDTGYQIYAPHEIFFHEFGHHLDDIASGTDHRKLHGWHGITTTAKLSNSKTLGKTIVDEVSAYRRKMQGDSTDTVEADKKILAEFKALDKKDKTLVGTVSDVFGGSTNNILRSSAGHNASYWKAPSTIFEWDDETGHAVKKKLSKAEKIAWKQNMVASEAFAGFTADTVTNPEGLKITKKYLPESYRMYLELIKNIIK